MIRVSRATTRAAHTRALIRSGKIDFGIMPVVCPHCASKPVVKREGVRFYVVCVNPHRCKVWPQTKNHETREAAITAWNTTHA